MKQLSPDLRYHEDPGPELAAGSVEDFLGRLGGATVILIPGRDRTRRRIYATLLHGNEPSGVRALHRWIAAGRQPQVDLLCLIGAVGAATTAPGFHYRVLPGHRDLNRCFAPPFDGQEGRVASAMLAQIDEAPCEAMLDVHNTSGQSPPYAVATIIDPARRVLAAAFAERYILSEIALGTLMEAMVGVCPMLTLECGGAADPGADEFAVDALEYFATTDDLFSPRFPDRSLSILHNPLRMEVIAGRRLAFGNEFRGDVDIVVREDLDRWNFGVVEPGSVVGWLPPADLGGVSPAEILRVRGREDIVPHDPWFAVEDGRLLVRQPLHLFMATTNPRIALGDCLFYFLDEQAVAEASVASGL